MGFSFTILVQDRKSSFNFVSIPNAINLKREPIISTVF